MTLCFGTCRRLASTPRFQGRKLVVRHRVPDSHATSSPKFEYHRHQPHRRAMGWPHSRNPAGHSLPTDEPTLRNRKIGDPVNLEGDVFGKVRRTSPGSPRAAKASGSLTLSELISGLVGCSICRRHVCDHTGLSSPTGCRTLCFFKGAGLDSSHPESPARGIIPRSLPRSPSTSPLIDLLQPQQNGLCTTVPTTSFNSNPNLSDASPRRNQRNKNCRQHYVRPNADVHASNYGTRTR